MGHKIEVIVLARHGDYHKGSGKLSDNGKEQMGRLAENLKPYLEGMTFKILSSDVERAIQSAEALAIVIDEKRRPIPVYNELHACNYREYSDLLSVVEQNADGKDKNGIEVKDKEKFDALICTTHQEVVEEFPKFIAEEYFNAKLSQDCFAVGKGCAWVIKAPVDGVCELTKVTW